MPRSGGYDRECSGQAALHPHCVRVNRSTSWGIAVVAVAAEPGVLFEVFFRITLRAGLLAPRIHRIAVQGYPEFGNPEPACTMN